MGRVTVNSIVPGGINLYALYDVLKEYGILVTIFLKRRHIAKIHIPVYSIQFA